MTLIEQAAKAGIPYGRLMDPALKAFSRDSEARGYHRGSHDGFRDGWVAARESLPAFLRRWIDPDGWIDA